MRTDPVPRTARGASSLLAWRLVLPALLAHLALAGPALGQVPDNRGPRLDPEDSLPPFYLGTVEERDRQRLDAAREAGETFIPVIPGPGTAPEAGHEAAGNVGSAPSPPRPAYEGYRQPERPAQRASGREDRAVGDLVGVLIESWTRAPAFARLRYSDAAAPGSPARVSGAAPSGGMPEELAEPDRWTTATILPPIATGRGLYARTLYAVDSDYPGPVLLELLEPPLAGAVASGGFTLVGERLVLRLDRLEYRGQTVPVDAWAVDPGCACYGVDGEVDSHWFSRVLLPSAVRFAEGFLGALSRPNETVIVQGGDLRYERLEASAEDAVHAGLATAARTAGDVLVESAPEGPTVRIPRDTELVVVFAAPPGGAEGPRGGGR
ncbi:MAG: DotG/IcmE/VirB10 family protein [Alphaproteobacteria bacterium]|nr:DotG/IcmE/VirB10 family protein [Alphaproteobacteria bacterium]